MFTLFIGIFSLSKKFRSTFDWDFRIVSALCCTLRDRKRGFMLNSQIRVRVPSQPHEMKTHLLIMMIDIRPEKNRMLAESLNYIFAFDMNK